MEMVACRLSIFKCNDLNVSVCTHRQEKLNNNIEQLFYANDISHYQNTNIAQLILDASKT